MVVSIKWGHKKRTELNVFIFVWENSVVGFQLLCHQRVVVWQPLTPRNTQLQCYINTITGGRAHTHTHTFPTTNHSHLNGRSRTSSKMNSRDRNIWLTATSKCSNNLLGTWHQHKTLYSTLEIQKYGVTHLDFKKGKSWQMQFLFSKEKKKKHYRNDKVMNLARNIIFTKICWRCQQHIIPVMFAKWKCAFVTVKIISVKLRSIN